MPTNGNIVPNTMLSAISGKRRIINNAITELKNKTFRTTGIRGSLISVASKRAVLVRCKKMSSRFGLSMGLRFVWFICFVDCCNISEIPSFCKPTKVIRITGNIGCERHTALLTSHITHTYPSLQMSTRKYYQTHKNCATQLYNRDAQFLCIGVSPNFSRRRRNVF